MQLHLWVRIACIKVPTPSTTQLTCLCSLCVATRAWTWLLQLDQTGPGDVGFDPLGLSNIDDLGIDYYWLREAELKHSRVAMLAIAGVLFCDQIGSFPGFPSGKSQMDLFWQVFAEKPSAIGAGVFAIAVLE
eukprot:12456-Heterococcus_DN1.PRE.1